MMGQAGGGDSNGFAFKTQVDAAASQIREAVCSRFALQGHASRTLGVALAHHSVRNFFTGPSAEVLKEMRYVSLASDAMRHLWNGSESPSLAVQLILHNAMAALAADAPADDDDGADGSGIPSISNSVSTLRPDAAVFVPLGVCQKLMEFYSPGGGFDAYEPWEQEGINQEVLQVLAEQAAEHLASSPEHSSSDDLRPSPRLRARERRRRRARSFMPPPPGLPLVPAHLTGLERSETPAALSAIGRQQEERTRHFYLGEIVDQHRSVEMVQDGHVPVQQEEVVHVPTQHSEGDIASCRLRARAAALFQAAWRGWALRTYAVDLRGAWDCCLCTDADTLCRSCRLLFLGCCE